MLIFLVESWRPQPKAIHTESYDVHQQDGNYKRCLLEHDPDALSIQALLQIRGSGDMARAIAAAGKLFALAPMASTSNGRRSGTSCPVVSSPSSCSR